MSLWKHSFFSAIVNSHLIIKMFDTIKYFSEVYEYTYTMKAEAQHKASLTSIFFYLTAIRLPIYTPVSRGSPFLLSSSSRSWYISRLQTAYPIYSIYVSQRVRASFALHIL